MSKITFYAAILTQILGGNEGGQIKNGIKNLNLRKNKYILEVYSPMLRLLSTNIMIPSWLSRFVTQKHNQPFAFHPCTVQTGRQDSSSAANRLIGEVVQSRRRPLLGPSPG